MLLLCACGRIGFDSTTRSEDGAIADTVTIDGMVVPAGPAVWLRMETDPTAGIIDSGGGHTVTCTTSCPTLAAGVHGMGYAFADNQVDVKPQADLQAGAGFTAAVWVKIASLPTAQVCPWNKTFNPTNGWDTLALCIDTTGAVIYDGETAGGTTASETSAPISLGQWHHIAVTWDGSTRLDWLDGAQVGLDTLVPGSGNMGMSLGGARNNYYVQGTLDEAIYYTRALTPAEIGLLATP